MLEGVVNGVLNDALDDDDGLYGWRRCGEEVVESVLESVLEGGLEGW